MLTSAVFLEFCLGGGEGGCLPRLGAGVSVGNAIFPEIPSGGDGVVTSMCRCEHGKSYFSWNFVWRGGGGLFTSRHRCARGKIPGILSGGGGDAGVSVGKFLEVTLNGARVGVQIANVINIFLDRDNKF